MILYVEALAAIALSLSLLMTGAWMVRERTGNSGWVDTIWTFSLGLVGAGSALWPIGGLCLMPGNGWSRPWWRSGRCGSGHISLFEPPGLPTTPVMFSCDGIGKSGNYPLSRERPRRPARIANMLTTDSVPSAHSAATLKLAVRLCCRASDRLTAALA